MEDILGFHEGVSWFNLGMVLAFNLLHYYCFNRIIIAEKMGVTSIWWIDCLGLNVLIQILYCKWEWPLKLYWLLPVYGLYIIWGYIKPFLSLLGFGGSSTPEPEKEKSNRQKKREAAEASGKTQ